MTTLTELPIDQLHDNPNQPRHAMHEDTIAGIAAAIVDHGGFPQEMAITVRRVDKGFEIIAGHHRVTAARRSGLTAVWGFVKDLDDRAALLALVASNNQTSMTPYEHGAAALRFKAAGVSYAEYSRAIGKPVNAVHTYVWGYEVLARFGGFKGRYADTPISVMAAIRSIEDQSTVDQIMYVIWHDKPGQAIAMAAIKAIKEGAPVMASFVKARAAERRKLEAAKGVSKERAGQFGGDHVDGVALMAWAAASFSKDQAATLYQASLYQAAMLEEYAARFGHLIASPAEFAASVLRRLETLKDENKLDEPNSDERIAS